MKYLTLLLIALTFVTFAYANCNFNGIGDCKKGCREPNEDPDIGECDNLKCLTYCYRVLGCIDTWEAACEVALDLIPNCDANCSPAGFIAPTFLSIISTLVFLFKILY